VRMSKPPTHWWQYAARGRQIASEGEFAELIPVKVEGPAIGLAQGPEFCRCFRRALIECVPDPVPELVSGHLADGSVSKESHLGFVPLSFVGHKHADGHIMGIGLLAPTGVTQSDRFALLKGLSKLKTLHTAIGNYAVDQFATSWSLKAERYSTESSEWVTVTPIELPTFPRKRLLASDLIASACEHSGLPKPSHVHVSQYGLVKGVPASRDFPRNRCPHYHARITFDRPVTGPVSIGRGRYLGHGLCLPVNREVRNA
jgi:CRISPR-associated protein Csb2